MRTVSTFLIACLTVTISFADENIALKTVKARTMDLKVPTEWKEEESASQMRVAQMSVPGKPENASLVAFYFGGPTGGVKANVDRWIGQFMEEKLKLQLFKGKCEVGTYVLVDTQGTWKRPDGPPFARKTITTPNSRVINIIVRQEKGADTDYYFIKLSGHEDVVSKHVKTIRTAIGADMDAEEKLDREKIK